MKHSILVFAAALSLGSCQAVDVQNATPQPDTTQRKSTMELGNFSVSLAVKDLKTSLAFYEKLGFAKCGGDATQGWIVLRNGPARVGLFQGMFEKNLMTFNPGWDPDAKALDEFEDVRDIQKRLKAAGVKLIAEADESTTGPAHITLIDPDGNQILIDQHVSK